MSAPVRHPRSRIVPALLLVAALGVAVVGCGADAAEVTSAAAGSAPAGPTLDPMGMTLRAAADGSALLHDDGEALHVLDPVTATERFSAVGGVASGDGASVVSAQANGGETDVVVRSVVDGSLRWTTAVAGMLEVVGASLGGETVVLVDPSAPAGTTSFVVVRFAFPTDPFLGDVRLMLPPAITSVPLPSSQRYDLAGDLEYDGIGDATSAVFVLERSPTEADAYKVRALDLADGVLADMSNREKFKPEGSMYGRYRSALVLPERGEVATLYTIDGGEGDGAAFVHLLNTRGVYADCLDLPAPLGRSAPSTLALAGVGSGNPLLVFDSAVGKVASLDPDVLGSVTTIDLTEPSLAAGHPAAIAVGEGSAYLAGGDTVVVLDIGSRESRSWPAGGRVTAMAVVPGTAGVAVIVDGEVRLFDAAGLRVDAPDRVAAVERPNATAVAPGSTAVPSRASVVTTGPTTSTSPSTAAPTTVGTTVLGGSRPGGAAPGPDERPTSGP